MLLRPTVFVIFYLPLDAHTLNTSTLFSVPTSVASFTSYSPPGVSRRFSAPAQGTVAASMGTSKENGRGSKSFFSATIPALIRGCFPLCTASTLVGSSSSSNSGSRRRCNSLLPPTPNTKHSRSNNNIHNQLTNPTYRQT